MTTKTQVREGLSETAQEPFPDVSAGGRRWQHLALSRSIDTRTLGKYRIAPMEPSTCPYVFDVTLFGATCAKIEMIWRRRLEWSDYLMAMKRAMERELGYRQNRREPEPPGGPVAIDVTVRDTDFTRAST